MEISKGSRTSRANISELAGNHHCLITADQHFGAQQDTKGLASSTGKKKKKKANVLRGWRGKGKGNRQSTSRKLLLFQDTQPITKAIKELKKQPRIASCANSS